jgi:hypothetical protein
MQFTPVPNAFFSNLLPQIGDIAELKTTLQVLAMLYRQRGYPRFIPYHQLLASKSLMSGLSSTARTVPAPRPGNGHPSGDTPQPIDRPRWCR